MTIVLVFFMGIVAYQIIGDEVLAAYGSTDAVVPDLKEKSELALSRLFAVALSVGALIIALYIKNAYNILMFAWSFYAASAGLPCFAALYWKKATKQGILAGMICGFVVCVGWKLVGLPFGIGATVPGTIACAVGLVSVSFATCRKYPSEFLSSECAQ
ncbi:MAG: hypothetical protein LUE65_13175 [Clostridiales bacterium]|nr:hypothetical protein [Clostridiales bacterium]